MQSTNNNSVLVKVLASLLLVWEMMPRTKWPMLAYSVVIDFIGYFNYVVPFLGEISDLAWAPMSAAAIYHLYGSAGAAGFGFVEELLPFTDFIPTATICWISRYLISPSRVDVDDVD